MKIMRQILFIKEKKENLQEEYYNIEKILGRRKQNGIIQYKIKWEGYPISQCTWEPMKNLETAKELVEEYDRTHPITLDKKSGKSEQKKKDKNTTLLTKKRSIKKDENENTIQENTPNEINHEDEAKNNENVTKQEINENLNENVHIIDDNLKNVITVKQEDNILKALVERIDDNGDIKRELISTEELRKTNPWILLDFYESKIKFT